MVSCRDKIWTINNFGNIKISIQEFPVFDISTLAQVILISKRINMHLNINLWYLEIHYFRSTKYIMPELYARKSSYLLIFIFYYIFSSRFKTTITFCAYNTLWKSINIYFNNARAGYGLLWLLLPVIWNCE